MAQSYPMAEDVRALAEKLDAVGWGLFFTWLGIAFLADVGWGVGLFGIGVIALAGQVARKHFGLAVEGFGLVIGLVFIAWGVWESFGIQLGEGFLPIVLVVVGVGIVASALLRKNRL